MKYSRQVFCDLTDKEKIKIIENELSLVTCDDKEYPVKRMRFKENLWYWTYGIYDGRILAWQPLPEPYRTADKPDWKENMLNTFLAGH